MFSLLIARSVVSVPEPYANAVPSVVRALAALEQVAAEPAGVTLAELRRRLGISGSSLLAILRTLTYRGYLAHDAVTGRYQLGPALPSLVGDVAPEVAAWRSADAVVTLA